MAKKIITMQGGIHRKDVVAVFPRKSSKYQNATIAVKYEPLFFSKCQAYLTLQILNLAHKFFYCTKSSV
jgi:hypothetical protein